MNSSRRSVRGQSEHCQYQLNMFATALGCLCWAVIFTGATALPLQRLSTFPNLAASDEELGIVNVVHPPYSADPSGQQDSTRAIQSAVEYGRANKLTVFVPNGTYRLTDTLNCTEHRDGFLQPITLVGEVSTKGRPTFFLPAKSTGFTNQSSPKYLVHFWEDDALKPSSRHHTFAEPPTPSTVKTNVNYHQIFQGINIRIGAGNFGAIGIRLRGAQGSNIEDCEVDLGDDGLIGIVGASGSGGSHAGVTVIGGKYGLDFRMAQPAPTITAARSCKPNLFCSDLLRPTDIDCCGPYC